MISLNGRRRRTSQRSAGPAGPGSTEVGRIDDAAFSRAWVESRHHGRGLASRALAAELRLRGVADETVQEAVSVLDSDQEESRARDLVDRRLPSTRGSDPVSRMRKLVG